MKNNAKAPMQALMEAIFLEDLGVLRIAGADAQRFLQGQLSSDVLQLAPGACSCLRAITIRRAGRLRCCASCSRRAR